MTPFPKPLLVCVIFIILAIPRVGPHALLRASEAQGAVSGIISAAEGSSTPVRRARVTLEDVDRGTSLAEVLTDDRGRFSFDAVPAGRYVVSASKAGYLPASYGSRRPAATGTPIVLREGQRADDLSLELTKGCVLSGTVYDESGRPAPDIVVSTQRFALSPETGERVLLNPRFGLRTTSTDDRGEYRLFGLEPGEYIVSAVWPPASELTTEVYRLTQGDIAVAQQLLRGVGGGGESTPRRAQRLVAAWRSPPSTTRQLCRLPTQLW